MESAWSCDKDWSQVQGDVKPTPHSWRAIGLVSAAVICMLVASILGAPSAEAEGTPLSVRFEGTVTAGGVYVRLDRSPFVFSPVVDAYGFGSGTIVRADGSLDSFGTVFTPGGTESAYGLAKFLAPALPDLPAYPFTARASSGTTPEATVGTGPLPDNPLVKGAIGTASARAGDANSSSEARSGALDLSGGAGVVVVESVKSAAELATQPGGLIRGVASVVLQRVKIANVVEIAEIKSTTIVSGDPAGSSSHSQTTLVGVTALGTAASIGSEGITVAKNALVAGDQVAALNENLQRKLDQAKVTVALAPQTNATQPSSAGQAASGESGGVVITFDGGIPATLPGGGDANRLTIQLGHTAGSLLASGGPGGALVASSDGPGNNASSQPVQDDAITVAQSRWNVAAVASRGVSAANAERKGHAPNQDLRNSTATDGQLDTGAGTVHQRGGDRLGQVLTSQPIASLSASRVSIRATRAKRARTAVIIGAAIVWPVLGRWKCNLRRAL